MASMSMDLGNQPLSQRSLEGQCEMSCPTGATRALKRSPTHSSLSLRVAGDTEVDETGRGEVLGRGTEAEKEGLKRTSV